MRNWYKAAALVLFFTGIAILSYPFVAGKWNAYRQTKVTQVYEQKIQKELSEEERRTFWESAVSYNENLEEQKENYEQELSMSDDGTMGYLWIPKIDSRLPIYHGTSEEVLQKGVGHLKKSHLPVGGEGTHCVLTGHRGLPSAVLFSKLDELEKGDVFYLMVLDKALTYQVKNIYTMVDKSDKETIDALLAPQEGKDLVTLITCTPYGVNTHRLLVQGERIFEKKQTENTEEEEPETGNVIAIIGLIGAVLIIGGFVRMKTLGVILLCGVLGVGTFWSSARAEGSTEISQKKTLTIYTDADVESLTVKIYRVDDAVSQDEARRTIPKESPLLTVEVKDGQKKVENLPRGTYLLQPENTEQYRFESQLVSLLAESVDGAGIEKGDGNGYVCLKYEKIQEVRSPKTGQKNWLQRILQPFFLYFLHMETFLQLAPDLSSPENTGADKGNDTNQQTQNPQEWNDVLHK